MGAHDLLMSTYPNLIACIDKTPCSCCGVILHGYFEMCVHVYKCIHNINAIYGASRAYIIHQANCLWPWFNSYKCFLLSDPLGDQLNRAFVQYSFTGKPHSIVSRPHGNSKSMVPFICTTPSTLGKLKRGNLPRK